MTSPADPPSDTLDQKPKWNSGDDIDDNADDNKNKIENVFFELGYQERLNILFQLSNNNKAKISSLSKDLNLPMPEIHRNITRLLSTGLIKKEADGIFSLTSYGDAVLMQIPTFAFLSRHSKYFSDHNFGEIPQRYIQSIGALDRCKFADSLVEGFDAITTVWRDRIENSNKFLYLMTPLTIDYFTELIFSQVREKGINLKYIVPTNAIFADRTEELRKKYAIHELVAKKVIERKTVGKVTVAILVNEKQALIVFPNEKGETDFTKLFYGEDKLFQQWCLDYFQFRWNNPDS